MRHRPEQGAEPPLGSSWIENGCSEYKLNPVALGLKTAPLDKRLTAPQREDCEDQNAPSSRTHTFRR
jgi:hypothetical protein